MNFRLINYLWIAISAGLLTACSPEPVADGASQADPNASTQIVATSRPLMLIAQELTRGIDELSAVATSGDSHDAALTPSELKRIRESDLVLWLGEDAQPGLAKQLDDLNAVSPSEWVTLPESRAHKGEKDPHFWFSSTQVAAYAQGLTDTLSKMHPVRTAVYANNLERFKQRLERINQQSVDMAGVKYLSAIDVYQSLEQQTGIEFDGALAEHDQPIKPSSLQQAAKSSATCILASNPDQPQALGKFNWIIVDELMRGVSSYSEGLSQAVSAVRGCQ